MLLDVYRIQISYTLFKPFLHTFGTVMFSVTDQQKSWKKDDGKSFVSTNTVHSLHINHNKGPFCSSSSDTLIYQLITFESSQIAQVLHVAIEITDIHIKIKYQTMLNKQF